jgi:hemolysin III
VLIACGILVAMAPGGVARWTSLVFGLSAVLLFGTSALYHRGSWSAKWHTLLRRLDHSNIFLVIVGSYTPLTALLLPARDAAILLSVVWIGGALGMALNLFAPGLPRWVGVPIYLALGWAAVAYLPQFLQYGGPWVLALVVVGGLLYTLGGLVYASKWPDPSPRWFGFHEVFHAFTVAAFACHFAAIALVVLRPAQVA